MLALGLVRLCLRASLPESLLPLKPVHFACRVAQTMDQQRSLLAERVPAQVLAAWGPAILESMLVQGLNRRGVLLSLDEAALQRYVLPAVVKQQLQEAWGILTACMPLCVSAALARLLDLLSLCLPAVHWWYVDVDSMTNAADRCAAFSACAQLAWQYEQLEAEAMLETWPDQRRNSPELGL